jgi:hypothetical protein
VYANRSKKLVREAAPTMQAETTPGSVWTAGWRLAGLYAVLAAMVIAPVLAAGVPVLGDYPNHLARIHILESFVTGSKLASFYERPRHLVPYQAMDVVMAALRTVLPLSAAGRVFLALCLLVPPAAASALRFVLHGRVGLAPAAGFLVSYNFLISRGLVDYLFSAGLAVALFAVWLAMSAGPRWQRAALCGAGLAIVFLGHAYAGVTYCILVAGDQIGVAVRRRFRPVADVAQDWAAAAAQTLPCLLMAAVFGASGTFGGAAVTQYGRVFRKVAALFTPVLFPGPDWIFAVFALLPPVVLLVWAARRLRLHPVLAGPALAVSVAAAVAPSVLFNAWATDMRLPLVLAIVLIAGLTPVRRPGRRIVLAAVAALCLLVAVRSAGAYVLLRQLDGQAAEVRFLVHALPEGARLLVVDTAQEDAPLRLVSPLLTGHLAFLATLDRDAFVPFLLTGATPVDVRPPFRAASSPNAGAIDMAQLRDGAVRTDQPGTTKPYGYGGNVYWLGWKTKFDFVMIMNFGADPGRLPDGLVEVGRVPVATLYKVQGDRH